METNTSTTPQYQSLPAPPEQDEGGSKRKWGLIAAGVIIAGLLIFGFVMLILADPATTAEVRDIFIIFMALILLLLMLSAVVLVVQLATLINLLQNEIKPMLQAMNETVNTVRGTTAFMSDNLVEPIIKVNSALAGFRGMRDFIRIFRR
jgi:hypothetical protein